MHRRRTSSLVSKGGGDEGTPTGRQMELASPSSLSSAASGSRERIGRSSTSRIMSRPGSSASASTLLSAIRSQAASEDGGPSCSLDLIKMKLDAELNATPKDERRTREYLHRTKMACGLVMSRRVAKLDGEDTRSQAGSEDSNSDIFGAVDQDKVKLPSVKSSSAPPSPHPGKERGDKSDKKLTLWPPPHTLARDRRKLSARARIEGTVEVEYKIPPGVTWSTNVSTKPKEWTDFILNKPSRIWNWGAKLQDIQATVEHEDPVVDEEPQLLEAEELLHITAGDKTSLNRLVNSMKTREDVAEEERRMKFMTACSIALKKMFREQTSNKGLASVAPKAKSHEDPLEETQTEESRLGTQHSTTTHHKAHEIPDGFMDMRDFGLLLLHLKLIPEKISKTDALHIFMDARGESKRKEIGYNEFQVAMQNVAISAATPLNEVLDVPLPKLPPVKSKDHVEERIMQGRDAQMIAERKALGSILEELDAIGDQASKPGSPMHRERKMSHSQDIFRLDLPTHTDVGGLEEGEEQEIDETVALNEIQDQLEELEDSFKDSMQDYGQYEGVRHGFDRELKDLIEKAEKVSPVSRRKLDHQAKKGPALYEVNKTVLPDLEEILDDIDDFLASVKRVRKPDADKEERGPSAVEAQLADFAPLSTQGSDSDMPSFKSVGVSRRLRTSLEYEARAQLEILGAEGFSDLDALDLIEATFSRAGIQVNDKEISRILLAARNPFDALKRELLSTMRSGKRKEALCAILKSLESHAHHDQVLPLLRRFLTDLREAIPTPARDEAWAFRLAAKVKMDPPKDCLVDQETHFDFEYRNIEAEKAVAHKAKLEEAQRLAAERQKNSRKGRRPAPKPEPQPLTPEEQAAQPQTESSWQHEEDLKKQQDLERVKADLDAKLAERLKVAVGLEKHSPNDWIGVCRVSRNIEDQDLSGVSKNVKTEMEGVQRTELRQLEIAQERIMDSDLIVCTVPLPEENQARLTLAKGIESPGEYVLKYFAEGQTVPLAVSEVFVVSLPDVEVECPREMEIGKQFQVKLRVTNVDYEGIRSAGLKEPIMGLWRPDWLGLFSVEDDSCSWKYSVPQWKEETVLKIEHFVIPVPGNFELRYMFGNAIGFSLGKAPMAVKFPRKNANRFASSDADVPSLQDVREARIFVSLNQTDMNKELQIMMKDMVNRLQIAVEHLHVTVTVVCLNWRSKKEEEAFSEGVHKTVRRHLVEIDRCRPFFLGFLGERYGHVPLLTQDEEEGMLNLAHEYPFITENRNPHLLTGLGLSLLELEYLYSVIIMPSERAFILHRDPGYVHNSIPEREREAYLQLGTGEVNLSIARSAMTDMKMRLRASHLDLNSYYSPQEGADMALQSVQKMIESEFQAEDVPDTVQKTTLVTEALSRSHRSVVDEVLFEEHIRRLDKLISDKCKIVVISGPAGCGKTTMASCWMHKHVARFIDDEPRKSVGKCVVAECKQGPRSDLSPHLFVASFLDSTHVDPTLEAVLHRLYSILKKTYNLPQRIPSNLQLREQFVPWMTEASKHGLVWLIEGIDTLRCDDFHWLNRCLYAISSGVQVIVTTRTGREDIISLLTSMAMGAEEMVLPLIDTAQLWSIHVKYLEAYGMESDDELIWKIVQCGSIKDPLHLRMVLMGYRLLSDVPGWDRLDSLLGCNDAGQVFVTIMMELMKYTSNSKKISTRRLAEILVLTSLAQRGLRESEILQITDLTQMDLHDYKDLALDELLVSSFGMLDFQSTLLKNALRQAYLNEPKIWDKGGERLVKKLVNFYLDPKKCAENRRTCQIPRLLVMQKDNEVLFNYLSSCLTASSFTETGEWHALDYFTEAMQLSVPDYVSTIQLDFQEKFGQKFDKDGDRRQNTQQSIQKALEALFRNFALKKTLRKKKQLFARIAFASRRDYNLSLQLPEWMSIMEYLEITATDGKLYIGTEEKPLGRTLSKEEVKKIYQASAQQQDSDPELVFSEFRYAMVQIAKKAGVQLADLVRTCLRTAQLRQIFNHFAVGRAQAHVEFGGVGKRARTMDFKEYSNLLEHMGLFKQLSRYEAHQFFKTANKHEAVSDSDDTELVFGEFKACMEAILGHLELNLEEIMDSNALAHVEGVDTSATVTFDMGYMSPKLREDFVTVSLNLCSLFAFIGADEGSIDIAQLVIASCHATDDFTELLIKEGANIYGTVEQIIEALLLFADSAVRMAKGMIEEDKDKRQKQSSLETNLNEMENLETLRRKNNAAAARQSLRARQEENEMQEAYNKKREKGQAELNELRKELEDNLSELRWIRRRAVTAKAVAERIKVLIKTLSQEMQDRLLNCLELLEGPQLSPVSKWKIIRQKELSAIAAAQLDTTPKEQKIEKL